MWFLSLFANNAARPLRRRKVNYTWLGGLAAISLATAIWGYGNVVMQVAETVVPPSLLLFMRFFLAAFILLPFLLQAKLRIRDWLAGLGVGVLLGLGVYSQGVAVQSVSVDEMAFIGALYVVLVPLMMALIQRRWPHPVVWLVAVASLLGVTLLIGHLSVGLQVGALWSLGGAVGMALQIIGTSALAVKTKPLALAGMQSLGAAISLLLPVLVYQWHHPGLVRSMFHWPHVVWWQVLYIALFAQALAVWLQVWGQRRVSETEAALAFNSEPVWTALFALFLLSQALTSLQLLGATLVVGSLSFIIWLSGKS